MDNFSLSTREKIASLEIGGTITFNLEKMNMVRSTASQLGLLMNRRYKTKTSRENRTINVMRVE